MPQVSRRLVLVSAAAAIAAPVSAAARGKSVPAAKAFPYLDAYLKLPPAQRSRFTLAYYLTVAGKPATGVQAWIVEGARRTPIPIGAEGRVLRLPTLGELGAGTILLDTSPDTKFGLQLEMEPLVRLATDFDAPSLVASIAQADAGVRKAAGLLGFAAPKLIRVYFKGGEGGEAVFADGRRVRLGMLKGMAYFDADSQHGARTIHFARAPTRMAIGPAA
jgi:hypothetical protein